MKTDNMKCDKCKKVSDELMAREIYKSMDVKWFCAICYKKVHKEDFEDPNTRMEYVQVETGDKLLQ